MVQSKKEYNHSSGKNFLWIMTSLEEQTGTQC